jgi:rhodanese-related sulfurtransferase
MYHYLNRFAFVVSIVLLLSGCDNKQEQIVQEKQSGLIIINVLDKDWYDDCHIKGSINVPFFELDEFVKKLDTEKAEIVLYCSNYFCTSSIYACRHLKDMGFKKVWAYEGGIAEWYQLGLPVEGPCQRAYLAKSVQPEHEMVSDDCLITAQELMQKIGS